MSAGSAPDFIGAGLAPAVALLVTGAFIEGLVFIGGNVFVGGGAQPPFCSDSAASTCACLRLKSGSPGSGAAGFLE
ncbi:hypothetical protein AM218_02410 [Hymenobacter sp. DG25A]|nr:hypothetical protein AM218_02410 [Hymenobacter sp. DG25A]